MESQDKLKAEESFHISENGYTLARLLDGTKCQLLLDTGTSKCFMSKSFYMQCKSLHTLPKFTSTVQRIQVGNGHYKIQQAILQQNLSRYYRFEEAEKLCEFLNKFVDIFKKGREQTTPTDKYSW